MAQRSEFLEEIRPSPIIFTEQREKARDPYSSTSLSTVLTFWGGFGSDPAEEWGQQQFPALGGFFSPGTLIPSTHLNSGLFSAQPENSPGITSQDRAAADVEWECCLQPALLLPANAVLCTQPCLGVPINSLLGSTPQESRIPAWSNLTVRSGEAPLEK